MNREIMGAYWHPLPQQGPNGYCGGKSEKHRRGERP
jgi:hypothetical protein